MTYDATVLALGPAMYLPMTEVAGSTTLADATGNGHAGSLAGGSSAIIGGATGFLTGEVGVAFPNTSAAVIFDMGAGFSTFGAWTLDYWAKFHAGSNNQDIMFTFSGPSYIESDLNQVDPATVAFDTFLGPTPIEFAGPSTPLAHPNCWHYFATTSDGAGNIRYYIDGALIATVVNAGGSGLSFTPVGGGVWASHFGGAGGFDLMHSAFYPARLSDVQIAANYAAATPRQDGACFSVPIRLRLNTGHVVYEGAEDQTKIRCNDQDAIVHDGTTLQVFTGEALSMKVPFVPAVDVPDQFIGIDPASGAPATARLPVTATASIAPVRAPVPVGTTPSTCDQMRCGAAINMTGHLISLYQHWAGVLDPLSSIAIKLGVGAAIAAGGELIVSAFAIEELAGAIFESITSKLTSLLSAATIGLFDSPTPDEAQVIQNGAYCALTCAGNVINPTAAQIQAWNDYLTANAGSFSAFNMQTALFNALLDFTPLLDWQLQAQTATPSMSCATMTCP